MNTQSTHSYTAFVGIGGADKKQDFCVQVAGEVEREIGIFAHTPELMMGDSQYHYLVTGKA